MRTLEDASYGFAVRRATRIAASRISGDNRVRKLPQRYVNSHARISMPSERPRLQVTQTGRWAIALFYPRGNRVELYCLASWSSSITGGILSCTTTFADGRQHL